MWWEVQEGKLRQWPGLLLVSQLIWPRLRFNALSIGLFLGSHRSCTLTWIGAILNMGTHLENLLGEALQRGTWRFW